MARTRQSRPTGILLAKGGRQLPAPTLETLDRHPRIQSLLREHGVEPDDPKRWPKLVIELALRYVPGMTSRRPSPGRPRKRSTEEDVQFRVALLRDIRAEQAKSRHTRLGVEGACARLKKREPYKSMKEEPGTLARMYRDTLHRLKNPAPSSPPAWTPFSRHGSAPGILALKKRGDNS